MWRTLWCAHQLTLVVFVHQLAKCQTWGSRTRFQNQCMKLQLIQAVVLLCVICTECSQRGQTLYLLKGIQKKHRTIVMQILSSMLIERQRRSVNSPIWRCFAFMVQTVISGLLSKQFQPPESTPGSGSGRIQARGRRGEKPETSGFAEYLKHWQRKRALIFGFTSVRGNVSQVCEHSGSGQLGSCCHALGPVLLVPVLMFCSS